MNDEERSALVQALEALSEEVRCLRMEQTVQRAALALLVRHLSVQGHAEIEALAQDLETMGSTQTEPGWQDGFSQIAGVLRLVHAQPSHERSRRWPDQG